MSVSLCVALRPARAESIRPAHAESNEGSAPFSVSLEYAVPEGCPAIDVFEDIVSKRLGYEPFSRRAPARVQVLITRGETATKGLLSWRDSGGSSTGEQTFPSRTNDCAELVAALGFALAVQIQLLAAAEPKAAPKPEASSTSPPPAKKVEEPPLLAATSGAAPKPRAGSGTAFALVAGGGAGLGFGMTAQAAPLFRLFGGVAWPHATLELAAEASLPQTTHRADGAGYSQQNVLGSAAGCGVQDPLSACLVVRAGAAHVSGQSIDVPQSASTALIQTGIRVGLTQRLARTIYLSVRGEGLVNLTRWKVSLDQQPVWELSRFAAVGGLDFGVLLF